MSIDDHVDAGVATRASWSPPATSRPSSAERGADPAVDLSPGPGRRSSVCMYIHVDSGEPPASGGHAMNTRSILKASVATLLAGTVVAVTAGSASADHVHSVEVGNGSCVLIGLHGAEGEVDLPFATDGQVAANRAHPVHLLVHLGRPGQNVAIGVFGTASDPCIDTGDYVND
jgi:hypothetical protein